MRYQPISVIRLFFSSLGHGSVNLAVRAPSARSIEVSSDRAPAGDIAHATARTPPRAGSSNGSCKRIESVASTASAFASLILAGDAALCASKRPWPAKMTPRIDQTSCRPVMGSHPSMPRNHFRKIPEHPPKVERRGPLLEREAMASLKPYGRQKVQERAA